MNSNDSNVQGIKIFKRERQSGGAYSFRGVSTGARFAGGVSGHDVSAGHAVQWRLILVDAGIRGVIGSWSRGLK